MASANVNISVVMQDILQTDVRFSCVFINNTTDEEAQNSCTFGIQPQFMTHTMYSSHHLITQAASESDVNTSCEATEPATATEMYICPICRKLLKSKKSLSIHVLIHYGKKRFKCSKCPLTYLYKTGLKTHYEKKHLPQPPNANLTVALPITQVCNVCLQTFSSFTSYQRHYNIEHSKKFKYVCQSCDFKCYYITQYKKHLKQYHL